MPLNDETEEQQQETTQEPSLRDELSAAFDAAEPAEPAETPAASSEEPAPATEDGRARDEKGRFAPKEKAESGGDHGAAPTAEAGATAGGKPAPAVPSAQPVVPGTTAVPQSAEQAPVVERAPQSWRPAAREHWAALPSDVRAEVQRREQEVGRTLQETAEARKTAQAFGEAVRPYEHMIRAEGGDPLRAVSSLFQTAAALRTAPPGRRAELVAQIVKGYGIDIGMLDAALAGQAMPAQAAQQQAPYDPRVDQLMARLDQSERQRQERETARQEREVETFSQGKEFFDDVREDMADVMELAAKRGDQLTLAQAYERAVALRPDIARVVQQREAAKAAANRTRSTQRSRAAASSVRSNAAVAPSKGEAASLRDALEDAFESSSGRA